MTDETPTVDPSAPVESPVAPAGTVGSTENPSWAYDVVHSSTDRMPQRPYTEVVNGTKIERA